MDKPEDPHTPEHIGVAEAGVRVGADVNRHRLHHELRAHNLSLWWLNKYWTLITTDANLSNAFAMIFLQHLFQHSKVFLFFIKFCFLGDIQTYRMIHLSIFMYEVHGAKKEKKVTFFLFFAVFGNKRMVKVHTILPRWNILGSMKTPFLMQCNGGISRLDQQTVRRLLRPPTQDVTGQETLGRVGFLPPLLYSIETN